MISDLATVTIISPNTSGLRTADISKVIVHHMAGDLTVEQCGSIFASPSRQASSNYGVGSDGRVGCYLPEEYHPWTTASYWADDRGVTIEVADADTSEWSPSAEAYAATVALCADICNRYGIEPTYTGGTDGSFVEHRMFAATSCPGPWWHDRMETFVEDVAKAMDPEPEEDEVRQEDIDAIVAAVAAIGEPFNAKGMYYTAHVSYVGWQSPVRDGQMAGTTGRGLAIEAIEFNPPKGIGLKASAHLADIGWKDYDLDGGGIIGTTGEGRAIEGIKLDASVPLRYRAHVQNIGWQEWVGNGELAGTEGEGLRVEAFQLVLA